MSLYQVTVLFGDCEIAYGEGERLDYAIQEARDQIEPVYSGLPLKATVLTPAGARSQIDIAA